MASPVRGRCRAVAGSPGSLAIMDHRAEAWYRRRTTHWQEWPLGRLLEPEEVAAAVVFLASPAAAAINGQAIVIDGGGLQA